MTSVIRSASDWGLKSVRKKKKRQSADPGFTVFELRQRFLWVRREWAPRINLNKPIGRTASVLAKLKRMGDVNGMEVALWRESLFEACLILVSKPETPLARKAVAQ